MTKKNSSEVAERAEAEVTTLGKVAGHSSAAPITNLIESAKEPLPFALLIPSGARNVVIPDTELAGQRSLEAAFLESKGLQLSIATFASTFTQAQSTVATQLATTDSTLVSTQTRSGNPVVSDDTNGDSHADVHPDNHADTVADHVSDD